MGGPESLFFRRKMCFQEEIMARFCFPGWGKAVQPQESSGASWEISEPRGIQTPSWGIKSAFLLLIPVSRASLQASPRPILETREGGGWPQSVVGLS